MFRIRRALAACSARRAVWTAMYGIAIIVAVGCLGPVASLYPPGPGDPSTPVWVVDHGWHTGLVLERAEIPGGLWPERDDLAPAPYLEVGWGDAAFYRAKEPGVGLAVRAALGSAGSALHVVALPALPQRIFPGREVVEIRLSLSGLQALVRFVDKSFARGERGRAPQLGPGLYGISAFYPARGRYHLLSTCNTWIADALRSAGVPITPAYAMTAGNLMWQARRVAIPAPVSR
jgi:uncharacterized protein (TIGR02117 family)